MPEELPPVKEASKPEHGVAKGSYTKRLQAMRANQAPVEASKPRLFKRPGKKTKEIIVPEPRKQLPADGKVAPRRSKGSGLCPPCTCTCPMTKHHGPWLVAELRAGSCKTCPSCQAYTPIKPAAADPVSSTVAKLQTRVNSGERITAKDAAAEFRSAPASSAVAIRADSTVTPDGRRIGVASKKQQNMAPERMKTILTEITAFADEMNHGGSSHLANIASDLQSTAHRLKTVLADLLISRLKPA